MVPPNEGARQELLYFRRFTLDLQRLPWVIPLEDCLDLECSAPGTYQQAPKSHFNEFEVLRVISRCK